ncbi:MCE family protein [Tomitella gaofuii]|uniref:MCE family protein n=1 Tax=Tomitella gaofuii TaxID=2760083 RepID=UPI0015F85C8A|nr:MCE family protein [Tomitella gaofuii]
MRRRVVVQLVLFVVIGLAATVFGVRYVAGPQSFGGAISVTIIADGASGVGAGASVTYRGVPIGRVTAVTIGGGAGPAGGTGDGKQAGGAVAIAADLDPGVRIPTSATARVAGASALGIRSVDLAADTDEGPYLRDGDTVSAPAEDRPKQLGALLADASAVLDTLDPDSLHSLGTTLSTAFEGTGPVLRRMIDDTDRITAALDAHAATIAGLVEGTLPVVGALADAGGGFPEAVAAAHRITRQLVEQKGTLTHLLSDSPAPLQMVGDLLTGARADITGLVTAGDTISAILGDRDAALGAGLTAFPETLDQLTSVLHDGRADFVLVATQGPVCYYDTPRRAVGDTSARPANLDLYCPPGEDLAQRGSRNAPRPDGLGLRNATRPGTPVGPPMAEDPWLIPTGRDLLRQATDGDGD